jgi:hypothetical protein
LEFVDVEIRDTQEKRYSGEEILRRRDTQKKRYSREKRRHSQEKEHQGFQFLALYSTHPHCIGRHCHSCLICIYLSILTSIENFPCEDKEC